MYESLKKHSKNNFHLYIFTFDNKSYELLKSLNLEYVTLVSLEEFEDERLLSVKSTRSIGEYCWTSTGLSIKYCIEKFNLDSCTYLDADIYFFDDPCVLLEEVSDGSTLITEHRYTKKYDQSNSSGKYCIQFITFHNNQHSIKLLNHWIDLCINWCYARVENGKFGDQKYLDDWTSKFDFVNELQHLGGGVAPWNMQQYLFNQKEDRIYGKTIKSKKSNQKFELVFFHFHALKFLDKNKIDLGSYDINDNILNTIYKPYLKHLYSLNNRFNLDLISSTSPKKSFNFMNLYYIFKRLFVDKKLFIRFIRKLFYSKNNIYNIDDLVRR